MLDLPRAQNWFHVLVRLLPMIHPHFRLKFILQNLMLLFLLVSLNSLVFMFRQEILGHLAQKLLQ